MKKQSKTRQQKRSMTVTHSTGKEMRVMEYLKRRSMDLPELTLRGGSPVDHSDNLRKIYMERGIPGVDRYIRTIKAISWRDTGKSIFRRLAGRLLVQWIKVTN